MSSRANHLETAASLDTCSFINALQKFISVRGAIRQLKSDRGTNFVGASRELCEAMEEMNHSQLQHHLSNQGCDYITFKHNTLSASHMGGVGERQIRTVRNVLPSLTHYFDASLDNESLRTFLCEMMAIVNCRPLTVDSLNDPLTTEPLTLNHLLTMKSKIILPPPGKFQRPYLYCRKRWRRIQYSTNEFWTRWKKEFLQTLKERRKWGGQQRNVSIVDVVLTKEDNTTRNTWKLGLAIETIPSNDGLVRKVKVSVGTTNLNRMGQRDRPLQTLERPIHKLVVLCEAETREVPHQGVKTCVTLFVSTLKNKYCLFWGSHVNVRVCVSTGIVFRLNFASRTGHFRMKGAGGTSGLNTSWREFGLFQIDWHARLTVFFVGH